MRLPSKCRSPEVASTSIEPLAKPRTSEVKVALPSEPIDQPAIGGRPRCPGTGVPDRPFRLRPDERTIWPFSTVAPVGGRREADRAAEQHGQRLVLRHRDHVDRVMVGSPRRWRRRRSSRCGRCRCASECRAPTGTSMSNRPWFMVIVRLLGGGIGGRAVDLDVAALLDPRRDQRDIAAARVDLRAGHDLDAAGAGLGLGEGRGKAVAAGGEAVRQVDRAQQQAADIEHGVGADDDSAGAVEPDVAAGRAAGELAEDACR